MKIDLNDWRQVEEGKKVRTQVMLTVALKRIIEAKRRLTNESMSQYLRRAALLRVMAEKEEEKRLNNLANLVVGSVDLNDHPEWKNKEKLNKWLKELRKEWD